MCLMVVGDGVVGLGVGLFVVRLLVSEAVGHDVGLMVVGDGVVGLGAWIACRESLPRFGSQSHLMSFSEIEIFSSMTPVR